MKRSELREKCRREADYPITLFLTNELSLVLTWLLMGSRITPNQVTLASMACGLAAGGCFALGLFAAGSAFLFAAHILDCTDGNLARAREQFSPLGRWLDMVSDRAAELFLFLGTGIHFFGQGALYPWALLSLLCGLLLMLYYYVVDVGLAIGIRPGAARDGVHWRGVRIKWGLFEPVLYGFIVLAPSGLIKAQLVLVLILCAAGLAYQSVKAARIDEAPDHPRK